MRTFCGLERALPDSTTAVITSAYYQPMGETPEDDDAPTDYRPTELGAAIDETDAHKPLGAGGRA